MPPERGPTGDVTMNAKERFASTVRMDDGVTAAWFSYVKLASRTGADPVALAEADVLGRLYDALRAIVEDASPCTSACNLVVESKLIDNATAVLAKHR